MLPVAYSAPVAEPPAVALSYTLDGEQYRWQAQLVRTEGVLDPRSRALFVVARVPDPYGIYQRRDTAFMPLRFGMFVDARLEGRRVDNVIPLPRGVIRPGNQVWIVDDNNRLQARKLSLLRTDGAEIVVTAGLDDGDRVCLTSIGPVLPGTRVSIASVARQGNAMGGERGERQSSRSEIATPPAAATAGEPNE